MQQVKVILFYFFIENGSAKFREFGKPIHRKFAVRYIFFQNTIDEIEKFLILICCCNQITIEYIFIREPFL